MQVFKLFLKILKKRLIPTIMFMGIFTLILMSISGSSAEETYKPSKLRLAVFDADGTKTSELAKKYISKGNEIVDLKDDDDQLLDALYYTTIHYAITINEGFEDKLSKGETDDLFTVRFVHEDYANVLADNKMNEYVQTISAFVKSGDDVVTAAKNAEKTLKKETEITYEAFEEDNSLTALFFQYVPYILFSAVLSSLGPVFIIMNRKEVKDRTHCSSVTPKTETFGKVLGASLFVAAVWLVFMIAGIFITGSGYSGRTLFAVLNSAVYALISAGISILVSTLITSENVLNVIVQIFGLGSSFLCGVFVPQEFLGSGVLTFAKILPAYWYIKANDTIFSLSDTVYSSSDVVTYIAVEGAFAAAVFAAAFIVARASRKKAK